MRKLLAVIKKDLRLLLGDRTQLISLFLMPLAFIVPISLSLPNETWVKPELEHVDGKFQVATARSKPLLPVVIYDKAFNAKETEGGNPVQELLEFLSETFDIETDFDQPAELGLTGTDACREPGPACDELVATTLVERQRRETALVIPADFSAAIEAGERSIMTLYYDPSGDAVQRQIHESVIKGAAMKLSIQNQVFSGFAQFQDLAAFAPQSVRDAIQEEMRSNGGRAGNPEYETDTEQAPALSVITVDASSFALAKRPDTYQQNIPGYTVMFVFFLAPFLKAIVQMEQNAGTFRRLLTMPVNRGQLLAGKMLSGLFVGIMQVTIMFSVGHFCFGMQLGQSPAALILVTIAVSLAAVCLGLVAAAFKVATVIYVPLILAALIGGCIVPADWLPQFVRTIAYAVPQSWAMMGYQGILVRGHGLVDVLPSILILLAFSVALFSIAVRRFEFE